MVLLASSYDQSKYFRAEDFAPGQEKKLKIKCVTEELIGIGADQQKKLTVWFTNSEKGLVLNKTNNRTLRGVFGDPVSEWTDKIIVLYRTEAEMRGRMVPALRVRIPPPKQATAGNGQPTKPVVKETLDTFAAPPKAPEPKPSLADDLDDEIGF
jgi:hypothetical protein